MKMEENSPPQCVSNHFTILNQHCMKDDTVMSELLKVP